ncbi:helix-turn-helix domain-containing protein [Microbacterium keratanolyticum]
MSESPFLLWDVTDASAATGLSVRYLRRMIAEKRIPVVRIGRLVRIKPSDLRAFIDANTRPADLRAAGR